MDFHGFLTLHDSSTYLFINGNQATGLLGRAVVAHFRRDGWKVVGTGLSRVDEDKNGKDDGGDDGDGGDRKGWDGERGSVRMMKLDLLDDDAVDRVMAEVRCVDWACS